MSVNYVRVEGLRRGGPLHFTVKGGFYIPARMDQVWEIQKVNTMHAHEY